MRRSSDVLVSGFVLALAVSACGGQSTPIPSAPGNTEYGVLSMARSDAASPLTVSPLVRALRESLGPIPDQWGRSDIKTFESDNWAGYAVVGDEFTEARGSWSVPSIDCAVNPNGAASFWVGIDGWSDDTVEQTGTESQCNGIKPVAYAWVEFAPKAGVTVMRVSPGDDMKGDVHYDGSEFVVTIVDLTTGKTFTTSAAVPRAKRASAEWITESNGSSGLPDFGVVNYGKDFTGAGDTNAATDATTSGPIGAFGKHVQVSIMAYKNKDEAVPSYLSSDGTSFSVTYWNP